MIEGLFKALVWDALVKAAIARLFAAVPFLAWGPVGFLVSHLLTKFADKLFEAASMAIAMEKIILTNEAHLKEYERASVKLKIIAREKGIESPEFKEARDAEKAALSKFVQFGA